jgi:hypothetical protein
MRPEFCKVPGEAPFHDPVDGHDYVCNGREQALATSDDVNLFNESSHFTLPVPWNPKTLTVVRQLVGTVAGTITSQPPRVGINCGSDCSEKYRSGEAVQLKLTAGGGVDVQWTGCQQAIGRTCSVTMSANRTVTARLTCDTSCYPECLVSCLDDGGLHSRCVPACRSACRCN